MAPLFSVTEDERGVTNYMHEPGNAPAAPVNHIGHVARELEGRAGGGPAQPVIDVVGGLVPPRAGFALASAAPVVLYSSYLILA